MDERRDAPVYECQSRMSAKTAKMIGYELFISTKVASSYSDSNEPVSL
jgi:hypothetical protein